MKVLWMVLVVLTATSCEFIRMKDDGTTSGEGRQPVARVNTAYLYRDELTGIVAPGTNRADSVSRVEAYVDSWIRKQLLIQEASRKINIDEADIERKILDYRYSLIAYEFQSQHIKKNLDTLVSASEIEAYYQANIDNFTLKQNIVMATFIKAPVNAPRLKNVKEWIFSRNEKDKQELKSFCLSFSAAYHLSDSTWMVFDDLVRNSPMSEIPNKVAFLKATPYYETKDDAFVYFLKVDQYRITDNVSPIEFVRDEIKNIILNRRKVELAKKHEDDIYTDAREREVFEIIR